jgi:hypothetical protein
LCVLILITYLQAHNLPMKEDVKLYALIAGKSALRWGLVVFAGVFFSLLFLIVLLVQYYGTGSGKFLVYFCNLWQTNLAAWVLIFCFPVFIFLYVVLANKIVIQSLVYELWSKKAVVYVEPALQRVVARITNNQQWMRDFSNKAMLRARILEAGKTDKTISSTSRKVLVFAFQRINLDDIDFSQEKLSLYDVLLTKLMQFISEMVEPGYVLVWLLLGLQTLLFVLAQYFQH